MDGMGSIGMDRIGMEGTGRDGNGRDGQYWTGWEWKGMERIGMERQYWMWGGHRWTQDTGGSTQLRKLSAHTSSYPYI